MSLLRGVRRQGIQNILICVIFWLEHSANQSSIEHQYESIPALSFLDIPCQCLVQLAILN